MKVLMKSLAVILAFSVLSASSYADWEFNILPEGIDASNSLANAADIAKQKNKSIIVYYTRTSCPPCDLLRSKIRYDDELLSALKDNYVFTAVWGNSMDRTERERYRTEYGVKGAPAWILFTSDAEYKCTASGGIYPNEDWKIVLKKMQDILKETTFTSNKPTNCRGG